MVGVGRDGKHSVVELKKTRRGRKRRVLDGEGEVTHSHLGVTWKVPVDAFWQSHISASAYYARWVADRLNGDMHTVWDLYGGCGRCPPACWGPHATLRLWTSQAAQHMLDGKLRAAREAL